MSGRRTSNHGQKAGISWKPSALSIKRGVENFSTNGTDRQLRLREMIHRHRVSEPTFQAIYGRVGEKGMVELAATIVLRRCWPAR